jgi:Flp pilus assembly protein TadG
MIAMRELRRGKLSAQGFAKREDGGMMVLSMIFFTLMVMIGGMAVDFMRQEHARVELQMTLDRSILAAASLKQMRDPEDVVEDYFTKAGMADKLLDVDYTPSMDTRIVTAHAKTTIPTFFMQMLDINELSSPAAGQAEESVRNVEVVLVLDVSGSMAGAKLTNLKNAAKEFVDIVKEKDELNRITITMVPYNAQVNVGPVLRAKYNAQNQHGVTNVNCLEVPASTYSTPTLSRTLAIPMSAYADMTSSTSQSTSYVSHTSTTSSGGATRITSQPFCRAEAGNIVRFHTDNKTTMKSWIDGLSANGNTSIMLGMRWGVALIDPGARPMFAELINEGQVPASFAGRPFDWNNPESMKVIVLMTDGEHVEHTFINNNYKTALSPIWRNAGDGYYSIRHTTGRPSSAGSNEYYVPHLNEWRATPYSTNSGGGATQQNWNQIWERQRVTWVAWQLYARALGTSSSTRTTQYNNAMNAMRSTFSTVANMNSQLQQTCTAAKNNGVIVYGIAFEAPTNGQNQIRSCASSVAHYFDANGLEISTAFRTIASNITRLRLTQ